MSRLHDDYRNEPDHTHDNSSGCTRGHSARPEERVRHFTSTRRPREQRDETAGGDLDGGVSSRLVDIPCRVTIGGGNNLELLFRHERW